MGLQPKYSDLILNLLVALAVSLVVNFSYVLLLIVDQKSDGQPRPAKASVIARGEEGTLRVSPDGHGYIVYENGDSVYVMMQRIYRMNLKDGDRLVANLAAPRRHGAHPVMTELRMRNGEEFDYSTLFNRPSKTTELALQLFYYLVVSFIMLSILTSCLLYTSWLVSGFNYTRTEPHSLSTRVNERHHQACMLKLRIIFFSANITGPILKSKFFGGYFRYLHICLLYTSRCV